MNHVVTIILLMRSVICLLYYSNCIDEFICIQDSEKPSITNTTLTSDLIGTSLTKPQISISEYKDEDSSFISDSSSYDGTANMEAFNYEGLKLIESKIIERYSKNNFNNLSTNKSEISMIIDTNRSRFVLGKRKHYSNCNSDNETLNPNTVLNNDFHRYGNKIDSLSKYEHSSVDIDLNNSNTIHEMNILQEKPLYSIYPRNDKLDIYNNLSLFKNNLYSKDPITRYNTVFEISHLRKNYEIYNFNLENISNPDDLLLNINNNCNGNIKNRNCENETIHHIYRNLCFTEDPIERHNQLFDESCIKDVSIDIITKNIGINEKIYNSFIEKNNQDQNFEPVLLKENLPKDTYSIDNSMDLTKDESIIDIKCNKNQECMKNVNNIKENEIIKSENYVFPIEKDEIYLEKIFRNNSKLVNHLKNSYNYNEIQLTWVENYNNLYRKDNLKHSFKNNFKSFNGINTKFCIYEYDNETILKLYFGEKQTIKKELYNIKNVMDIQKLPNIDNKINHNINKSNINVDNVTKCIIQNNAIDKMNDKRNVNICSEHNDLILSNVLDFNKVNHMNLKENTCNSKVRIIKMDKLNSISVLKEQEDLYATSNIHTFYNEYDMSYSNSLISYNKCKKRDDNSLLLIKDSCIMSENTDYSLSKNNETFNYNNSKSHANITCNDVFGEDLFEALNISPDDLINLDAPSLPVGWTRISPEHGLYYQDLL